MSQNAATIMLVEDETLIALDMASELKEEGYTVLGPFKTAKAALADLESRRPDAALLDFNLNNEQTGEVVADRLVELNIPFAFLTGYASTKLMQDSRYGDYPILAKPPAIEDLRRVLGDLLSDRE